MWPAPVSTLRFLPCRVRPFPARFVCRDDIAPVRRVGVVRCPWQVPPTHASPVSTPSRRSRARS